MHQAFYPYVFSYVNAGVGQLAMPRGYPVLLKVGCFFVLLQAGCIPGEEFLAESAVTYFVGAAYEHPVG